MRICSTSSPPESKARRCRRLGSSNAEEREAIISYVIHLSIRGEVEYLTMADQFKDEKLKVTMTLREDFKSPTVKDAMEDNLAFVASKWINAAETGRRHHSDRVHVWPGREIVS